MKTISKFMFRLATVLTLVFGVYSCSSDETEKLDLKNSLFKKSSSVGALHNEALAYTFEKLVENRLTIDSPDLNDSLKSIVSAFFISVEPDTRLHPIIVDDVNNAFEYYKTHGESDLSTLSVELRAEVNKLIELVEDTVTEDNEEAGEGLFTLSQKLLANPPHQLNPEEQQAWSYAVDVMGHSAIYWSDGGIDNWNDNLNGNLVTANGFWRNVWRIVKNVVSADATGALAGGEIGGHFGKPELGASIGAAVGSVAAIVDEIIGEEAPAEPE